MIYTTTYDAPFGSITLAATDCALVALQFNQGKKTWEQIESVTTEKETEILTNTKKELDLYFALKLKKFTIAIAPEGTVFQQKVWQQLLAIPFGELRTYGNLAKAIAQPTASRAVGAANGKNPIGIIVPCHRVIGNGGALTGFAGGMAVKEFLLKLEGYNTLF